MRKRLVIGLALLLAACAATATPVAENSPLPLTVTVPPNATSVPTITSTPTRTPQPSPTPMITATATPAGSLTEEGPWLVFMAGTEDYGNTKYLWAINADGTGLTRLSENPVVVLRAQPDDSTGYRRLVAFITSSPYGNEDLVLHIISLPSFETLLSLPLTSTQTGIHISSTEEAYDETRSQIAGAIIDTDNLAWSPDGTELAFIGAMDGPSADVYKYSIDTQGITRLTEGETQAISPLWSPDGQYVANIAVNQFGAGQLDIPGIWASRSDGAGSVFLYNPAGIGNPRYVGWSRVYGLIFHGWSQTWGNQDLLSVDPGSGEVKTFWSGCFGDVALDPASGALVLTLDEGSLDCPSPNASGVYFRRPGMENWERIKDGSSNIGQYLVFWSGTANRFVVSTPNSTWLTVDSTGQVFGPFGPPLSQLIISPDGQRWAWYGDSRNIWVGSPTEEPALFDSHRMRSALWTPDSQELIYSTPGGLLYVTHGAEFQSELVARGLYTFYAGYGMTWLP